MSDHFERLGPVVQGPALTPAALVHLADTLRRMAGYLETNAYGGTVLGPYALEGHAVVTRGELEPAAPADVAGEIIVSVRIERTAKP